MTKMKFLKAESSYRSQSSESSVAFLLTPDIGAKRGKRKIQYSTLAKKKINKNVLSKKIIKTDSFRNIQEKCPS